MAESKGEAPPRRQWRYPDRSEHPDVSVFVYDDWCKCCGICYELCPAGVMTADKTGRPVVTNPDACTACGLCEILCPDMAVTVYAERGKRTCSRSEGSPASESGSPSGDGSISGSCGRAAESNGLCSSESDSGPPGAEGAKDA